MIPVDMIKEKIDRMNENLERLEKKYTNKEILMMSGAGEQNIQENTIKTFVDFEGSSLTH
jgi:hypothetical protein